MVSIVGPDDYGPPNSVTQLEHDVIPLSLGEKKKEDAIGIEP